VVRQLEAAWPARKKQPLPYPLRILVVKDNSDRSLDLGREQQLLEELWGDSSAVEIVVERAELSAVREALIRKRCHVLHYMGHGLLDQGNGAGVLPFRDEEGELQLVDGEQLAIQLRDATSLQLVFLNACHTARGYGGRHCASPGAAAALVKRGGLPAVLAMQLPISDQAALRFCRAFYQSLAKGDPIDTATSEGRLAIQRCDRSTEWFTPVLFIRADDGRLFAPSPQPTEQAARKEPSPGSIRGRLRQARGRIGAALAERLNHASVFAKVKAIPAYFPPDADDERRLCGEADLVIDCTASDDVPFLLESFDWPSARLFVSCSLGLHAKQLYLFSTQGDRFPRREFFEAVYPWVRQLMAEHDDEDFPREGIGCWHPVFPARIDDIWLMVAIAINQINALLVEENHSTQLTVFEREAGGGVRKVREGGLDGDVDRVQF
jgi:hypothetical protein